MDSLNDNLKRYHTHLLGLNKLISKESIYNCQQENVWDLGNSVLYNLCTNNFEHDTDDKIIAKVWLIGRSYAAAIERRKNKNNSSESNDNFYTESVTKVFRSSEIDQQLSFLKALSLNETLIPTILKTHRYLTDNLFKITLQNKRSFCSKYLHFHLPEIYFLYDTRAVNAMRIFTKKLPKSMEELIANDTVDSEYGKFFCKCFLLQHDIYEKTGTLLTPRQLDNFLLNISHEVPNNK